MKKDTIDFHYNLHVNFQSFERTLDTAIKYHPGSFIFCHVDKSNPMFDDYENHWSHIGCMSLTIRKNPCVYIDRDYDDNTRNTMMLEWLDRLHTTAKRSSAKWIINLEDDVLFKGTVTRFPETKVAGNHDQIGGLGGGSIMSRKAILDIFDEFDQDELVHKMQENKIFSWAADNFLKHLFDCVGYKYSKFPEIYEDWFNYPYTDEAIIHGDKTLYNEDYLKQRGLR